MCLTTLSHSVLACALSIKNNPSYILKFYSSYFDIYTIKYKTVLYLYIHTKRSIKFIHTNLDAFEYPGFQCLTSLFDSLRCHVLFFFRKYGEDIIAWIPVCRSPDPNL